MADAEEELLVRMRKIGTTRGKDGEMWHCAGVGGQKEERGKKEDADETPHMDLDWHWIMACAAMLVPLTMLLRFIFFKHHLKAMFQFPQDFKIKNAKY